MRNLITSFSNDRIKFVGKLRDKKFREFEQKFIIEGYRENLKAVNSGKIRFDSMFISPECYLGKNEENLINKINSRIFELPRKVFEKISYRDRPDGILTIAEMPDFQFDTSEKPVGDLYLIIEGVEKPGNLGTILRTAEGAGVSSVIVVDPKIDLFNPNVIRSSTGTLFTLPTYVSDAGTVLKYFKENKIRLIAVSPDGQTIYYNENMKAPSAFIFGSEQYGLSEFSKSDSDKIICIPMKGEADSLNLAMSCGIILYEALRQRQSV